MVGLSLLSTAQGITAVGNGLERWQHLSTEPPAWKGVPWLQRQPESSEGLILKNQCCLLGTSEQGKRAKERCVFRSSCVCQESCGCGASREEEAHATHRMRLCNESWVENPTNQSPWVLLNHRWNQNWKQDNLSTPIISNSCSGLIGENQNSELWLVRSLNME